MSNSLDPAVINWYQAMNDSMLGSTLLQSFLTGFSTLLLALVNVKLVKQRKRYLILILNALYISTLMNLATGWWFLHSAFVIHNATWETMIQATTTFALSPMGIFNDITEFMSIWLADILLVWRCYVVCQKNKCILAVLSLLLLAQLALIPVYILFNDLGFGPHHIPVLSLNPIISSGITSIATGLIVYRIIDVSKQSNNKVHSRYQFIIKILVESGALYTTCMILFGVLYIAAYTAGSNNGAKVAQASTYFGAIIVPITVIAPTLITARIVLGTSSADTEWEQPLSALIFQQSHGVSHQHVEVGTASV